MRTSRNDPRIDVSLGVVVVLVLLLVLAWLLELFILFLLG